jgi:SAM-dependent methyltransferase
MKYNNQQYFDFHWKHRSGKTIENPFIAQKIDIISDIIPKNVNTIVDIGCGDGTITNILAKRFKVIGLDYSIEALKNLTTLAICSSADEIGLRDKCVDLVLSSEMLEHLNDNSFVKAIFEMKRVSRRYILITVPNNEKLRRRYTKCRTCGSEFHVYYHLRSFNLNKLISNFDDYNVCYFTSSGPLELNSFDMISHLKNKLANSYFSVGHPIKCVNCASIVDLSTHRRNLFQKIVGKFLDSSQGILNIMLNKKPQPYWLIVLFEI